MSEERHGIFIQVEVDDAIAADPEVAAKLAEVCPVDIFAAGEGDLQIVEQNLDECVLCDLCVTAAAESGKGAVRIVKLYE